MWMSVEKRRAFSKETSNLPFLRSVTREEGELATKLRGDMLELLFDQYLSPDSASINISTTSRWKRARQLWKVMITEKRASYFIDLKSSGYLEWVKSGRTTLLPCPSSTVAEMNKKLREMIGSKSDMDQARVVRATFLKCIDEYEKILYEGKVSEEKVQRLRTLCDYLQNGTTAEFFLKNQPKEFTGYEEVSC